jgi:hypothetical protein
MKNDLTAEELRNRLYYNPISGDLSWIDGPRAGRMSGCLCKTTGYIHIKLNQYQYLAHRLAWLHHYGEWPIGWLDHRDRNRSNNSIDNLRECTPTQNHANAGNKSSNSSGFKGVSFDMRRGKFRADIRIGGKKKTLGYFHDPVAASRHYKMAAISAHGEFALVGEGN